MQGISRQELQSALDRTRDNLSSRMLSKGDVQSLITQVKDGLLQDLHQLHNENQALIKNGQARHDQINHRLTNLERNVHILVQNLDKLTVALGRLTEDVERQPQGSFMFQRL